MRSLACWTPMGGDSHSLGNIKQSARDKENGKKKPAFYIISLIPVCPCIDWSELMLLRILVVLSQLSQGFSGRLASQSWVNGFKMQVFMGPGCRGSWNSQGSSEIWNAIHGMGVGSPDQASQVLSDSTRVAATDHAWLGEDNPLLVKESEQIKSSLHPLG